MYPNNQKEKTFTVTGYGNWKMALVKGSGFAKHEMEGAAVP